MKNFFHKNLENISILFVIIIFGILYWRTVMVLPLYGDATIHGYHANVIIEKGWQYLMADYPGLYYYIVNAVGLIIGVKGYNLIVYIGVFLILIYSYLLSYRLTSNKFIGIFILILAGFSSKLIFYSARLYQEILITGLFLIAFYYLALATYQNKRKYFYLLIFFISVTLSVKQQGLLILYVSVLLFYIIRVFLGRSTLKDVLILSISPLIIGLGFYGILFHNTGRLIIGNEDYKAVNIINYIGQKIFQYNGNSHKLNNFEYAYYLNESQINDDTERTDITARLSDIQREYYSTGTINAQIRQIKFFDIFIDFGKFNNAHNIFNQPFGYAGYANIEYLLFIFIVGGFIIFIPNKGLAKKHKFILIYLFIFLSLNYFLFQRNTDQARYHLFMPFYLVFFICFFIKNTHITRKSLYIISILIFISLLGISIPFYEKNKGAINSQLYSPSIGGIQSIIEVGKWIEKNTDDGRVFQICGNETQFYSKKELAGDWRIYYLSSSEILEYFKEEKINYFVLFKSQVKSDDDWKNLCNVPISFLPKLESVSSIIYTSDLEDIEIYKIK